MNTFIFNLKAKLFGFNTSYISSFFFLKLQLGLPEMIYETHLPFKNKGIFWPLQLDINMNIPEDILKEKTPAVERKAGLSKES